MKFSIFKLFGFFGIVFLEYAMWLVTGKTGMFQFFKE